MESGNAVVGALIFLGLIIGANLVMYAIARGATRGGGSSWISSLKQGLSKPLDSPANKSMDELHLKIKELQTGVKKEE